MEEAVNSHGPSALFLKETITSVYNSYIAEKQENNLEERTEEKTELLTLKEHSSSSNTKLNINSN